MSQPTVQEEHTTTNQGGKGGDRVLLRVPYGRGDCGVESEKEEGTQQPTTEAREEITYSYMSSPRWTRDMQQPTGETREETAYSYALRLRRMRRPHCRVRGGTYNNQPGGKVKSSIFWSIIINDAPRNGRVFRGRNTLRTRMLRVWLIRAGMDRYGKYLGWIW